MPSQTIARLPTGPEDSVCQIWVVSDGTPGMRLQAVAMAESLLKARPDWEYEQFTVTPHRWIRALPRLATAVPKIPLYDTAKDGMLDRRPHAGRYPHILCLLYTSPSPRDGLLSRMPSSA